LHVGTDTVRVLYRGPCGPRIRIVARKKDAQEEEEEDSSACEEKSVD
jgi:hypothetical protein